MIELTFQDSAAGALKCALAGERKRRRANAALERPSSGDILPLTLALDLGKLTLPEGQGDGREAALETAFGFFPEAEEVIRCLRAQNGAALARLQSAGARGEGVRLWVSRACPGEVCGLLYACALPELEPAPLYCVTIPDEGEDGVPIRHSGDLSGEALWALAEGAKPVSPAQRRAYGARWRELAEENAPLRAMVNGRLLSVSQDFYDGFLRENMPQGDFPAALCIGRTLLRVPGVGDGWLYRRLLELTRRGELAMVSPPQTDSPYSGIFRKA